MLVYDIPMKRLLITAMLIGTSTQAQDFSRSKLVSGTNAQASYVSGQEHWHEGKVAWYYNPANQPAHLSTADVVNAIKTAANRWAGMCNLTFTFMGLTTKAANVRSTAGSIDGSNVFGWGVLTDEMAGYGAYTKWWYDANQSMVDADVVLNTLTSWSISQVESIMTHEIGHVIGLNHSNVQASVMYASPYNSFSYQRTLRGDDAKGCAALYGASAEAQSNRAMNWAEQTYPLYFSPSPATSGTYEGYYYRHYPGTNHYLGTKDGRAYLMGPDNTIRDQGILNGFTPLIEGAGF